MMKCLIFIYVMYLFTESFVISTQWSYPDRENNERDPSWGGLCDAGRKQSPIELYAMSSFPGNFDDFHFENFDEVLNSSIFTNTGHSVQINILGEKSMQLSGGGLPATYIFQQIHWHWWSEHKINGLRYPLEVHLVHKNERYKTVVEAAKHKNGLSVLGVLFHVSDKPNHSLDMILANLQSIANYTGKSIVLNEKVKLKDFLPENKNEYFRYEGSLTTPGCEESVIWTVFENTIPVTLTQVEQFMNIKDVAGRNLKSNYRSTQLQNNRAITYINSFTRSTANKYNVSNLFKIILIACMMKIIT